MNNLSCNIVQDLLPNYIENLTSDKTKSEIENHLKSCSKCNAIYRDMIGGEISIDESVQKEINYLKKINNKTIKIIVSIILAVIILLSIPFTKYCIIGIKDSLYGITISVENDTITGEGYLFSSAATLSDIKYDYNDGVVTINVYSALPVLRKNAVSNFDIYYVADNAIKRVQTSYGYVLWEGIDISRCANDIFNARTQYIGNNSAVSNLVDNVILNSDYTLIKDYSIHLITNSKPYGLEVNKLHINGKLSDKEYDRIIRRDAILMLAGVENLDFVTIYYRLPSGIDKECTVNLEDINKELAYNIKDKTNSVRGLQELINDINI